MTLSARLYFKGTALAPALTDLFVMGLCCNRSPKRISGLLKRQKKLCRFLTRYMVQKCCSWPLFLAGMEGEHSHSPALFHQEGLCNQQHQHRTMGRILKSTQCWPKSPTGINGSLTTNINIQNFLKIPPFVADSCTGVKGEREKNSSFPLHSYTLF